MPRDVGIRESFGADAAYLTRLSRSVEIDKSRPREWRQEVMEALRKLTIMLLEAPPRGSKKTGSDD